jgi:hypothetical protein
MASKTTQWPNGDQIDDVVDALPTRRHFQFRDCLKALASLRLTVILFVLALLLVFFGTLAQVDLSNWTVVKSYFRSYAVWVPFQTLLRFAQTFFWVPKDAYWPGGFPFIGGKVLGALLMANLIAAHLTRFRLSLKRSGILILHAGLMFLLINEFLTDAYAIEGHMTIVTGHSSNYVEESNTCELAVTDRSDPKEDAVTVVPASLLTNGAVIHDEELPFDIEVVKYMKNSALTDGPPPKDNPATVGAGLSTGVAEKPEGRGVDKDQRIDAPSAYITFKKKGSDQPLGTYLVSMWLREQPVEVDGKKYEVSLRSKRTYKPYTVHLDRFDHDLYPGSNKPKNYSSQVRLIDPTRGENRDTLVSMNNPLRYGVETFYQSGVLPNDAGTILQVVKSPGATVAGFTLPGWIIPYVACTMVSLGMIIHFLIHLTGFLSLRARK